MRELWSRLSAWLRGRASIQEELDLEIDSHIDLEAESYIEEGMNPSEARRAARRRFGNPTLAGENARDAWAFVWLENLLTDIRHAFRAVRRSPLFSLVLILTFALGVGLNSAMFSVVRMVLLSPLPYPYAERLVRLGEATENAAGISVTWVNFQQWREANHTFDEMAAFEFTSKTLAGPIEPMVTRGLVVTSPHFALLGKNAFAGRLFTSDDDHPGASATVVLSHRFWLNQLGGDRRLIGSTLILDGSPYEVIGVADATWEPWRVDYYLPLTRAAGSQTDRRQHGSIRALGSLRPGVSLPTAKADLDRIMQRLSEVDPGPESAHRSFGQYLTEYTTGEVRTTLLMLMGAAALILLIACANVTSLLLARNTARSVEIAIRKAIGSGFGRIVRQLLTETLVIAALGGMAGIALAYWSLRSLLALAPVGVVPRLDQTSLNLSVLLFAFAITLTAGAAAGLAPVLFARRVNIAGALNSGVRLAGVRPSRQRFRNALVVSQVALTFVLAFGSGLLIRSLIAAQSANPGCDVHGVVSFSLQVPPKTYKTTEAVRGFYSQLTDIVRSLPGVTEVSSVHCPPGAGDCGDWFYSIVGRPQPPQNEVPVSLFNTAEAGYFRAMRIPMTQGREFGASDTATAPPVAVVNETFARRWWPGESAIGRQIKVGGPYREGGVLQMIGVGGDIRQAGLDTQPLEEIFQPASQNPMRTMTIMVRTLGDASALMPAIRSRVSELDRNLPLQRMGKLADSLDAGLSRRRFITILLTAFAGLAMLLAGIGIYGLLTYWVTSREPEIAIRLALGAQPSNILGWTTAHAFRLTVAGVALGVCCGWAAARVLDELVFGFPSRNLATMVAAAAAILALGIAAAAIPAWRASRVDAARRLNYG